jgi:hypothetical protein
MTNFNKVGNGHITARLSVSVLKSLQLVVPFSPLGCQLLLFFLEYYTLSGVLLFALQCLEEFSTCRYG